MKSKIIAGAVAAIAIASVALPAFAAESSTPSSGKAVTQAERMKALGARGEKEIDTRVESLNKLITRIQGLRNVSDAQKTSIISTLQSLITNLTNLKAQIGSEASSTALKAEVEAITQNYRVYALAIPQLNIFAAADRITTIVAMMNILGSKMQSRLASATGMPNMTDLQAKLADYGAKMTDANTQAQAAVTAVSPLTPDMGDKDKMAANLAAMKDARKKIQAAQQDIVAARKDAKAIIDALVKYDKSMTQDLRGNGNATSTGTSTGR